MSIEKLNENSNKSEPINLNIFTKENTENLVNIRENISNKKDFFTKINCDDSEKCANISIIESMENAFNKDINKKNENIKKINQTSKFQSRKHSPNYSIVSNRYEEKKLLNNYNYQNNKLDEKYDSLINAEKDFKTYVGNTNESNSDLIKTPNYKANSLNKSTQSNSSFFKDQKKSYDDFKQSKYKLPNLKKNFSFEKKKNMTSIYKRNIIQLQDY